ncbi:MAG: hypothetical protein DMF61_07795 [Blastocatellia bacterium AA13]|nr:MAG: hypothetical protein DMF61_07795 [Blastocatellia bacterium AA13]
MRVHSEDSGQKEIVTRCEGAMKIKIRYFTSLALSVLISLTVISGPCAASTISSRSVEAEPAGQTFTLVSLKHETVGALTRILVESNAPPLYTVFRPTDQLIIVDMPGGDGSGLAAEYQVKNALVDSIKVRKTGGGGARSESAKAVTRLEISVRGPMRDRSSLKGNTLVIELSPEQTAEAAEVQPLSTPGIERPGVYVQPKSVSATVKTASTDTVAKPSKADYSTSRVNADKPATLVRDVRADRTARGVKIFIDTDGKAQFKDFTLTNPDRIVVDVVGVKNALGNRNIELGSGSVERVRVGQPSASVVRIVLDSTSKSAYHVAREGSSLVVSIGEGSAEDAGAKAVPVVNPPAQTRAQTPAQTHIPVTQGVKTNSAEKTKQDLAPSTSTKDDSNKNQTQAIARNNPPAQVPPAVSKPGVTNGGTTSGKTTQSTSGAKEKITSEVSSLPINTPAGYRSATEAQRGNERIIAGNSPATGTTPSRPQSGRARQEGAFCDPGFVGGPTSFDLRSGVDIRDMLRFISAQYGVNFIVDKSVGTVPVDIRVTEMPWNMVMEEVMRANRLGAVCGGGGRIIRIATLAAIKEEQEAQRSLKEEQAKSIPLETKIFHLKYARAAGALSATGSGRSGGGGSGGGGGSSSGGGGGGGGTSGNRGIIQIINSRLSTRGKSEVDGRTNSLIITDLPENIKSIEDILAKLDLPEPQVEIEARIVIANRSFLRDIGVELAAAAVNTKTGASAIGETSAVGISPTGGLANAGGTAGGGGAGGSSGGTNPLGPNLVGPISTNALRATASSVLSLTTGLLGTSIISTALSAHERKGQIRTIAAPRITAQDNQTAEIVNGVQIPVQTVSNNTITTTFVTAALRLEITPQIIEETGEVQMHVVAENNSVNTAIAQQLNSGIPGIDTQSAESTVRVTDGGTTVMGGITVDRESQFQTRTPGLSKLPIFGNLFKRRETERNADEILFFITPRIVRGEGPSNLAPQRSAVEGAAAGNQVASKGAGAQPEQKAAQNNQPVAKAPAAPAKGGQQ